MPVTVMNELWALNEILSSVGEAPVASIVDAETGETFVDIQIILGRLRTANDAMQRQGWHWNKIFNLTLTPEVDGTVLIPADALNIFNIKEASKSEVWVPRYVVRGNRIWDREVDTDIISKPLVVDYVRMVPFEDLPNDAKWYVIYRASREYLARFGGETTQIREIGMNEREAWVRLNNEDALARRQSYLTPHEHISLLKGYI